VAGATYSYAVSAIDRRGNESAIGSVVRVETDPHPYAPQEIELHFDQATLEGNVKVNKGNGTRARTYVIIPEKATPEEVAGAKARWEIDVAHAGKFYFWLRYLPDGPTSVRAAAINQNLKVLLDGRQITTVGGGPTDLSAPDSLVRPEFWTWARPVTSDLIAVELPKGKHELSVTNWTKAVRYDVLLITDEPAFLPKDGRIRQQ